jgi:hypothetical protein
MHDHCAINNKRFVDQFWDKSPAVDDRTKHVTYTVVVTACAAQTGKAAPCANLPAVTE